ncbi:MAG: PD-(D/E)XK nuclease family protein [Candidatus Aenigmarchaeota archaeon]|nr:PD-(D/E)XK nuclease family protein [Candidatus Aenigmarchaeota archaeon]
MFEEFYPRKFRVPMNISDFAKLGFSQSSFFSGVKKRSQDFTKRQLSGQEAAFLDREKIRGWLESDYKFVMEEVPVSDANDNFVGRMDRLEFLGIGEYGNKQLVIIEYKTRNISGVMNPKFFDDYKIQLATYAFCLKNHPIFHDCDINFAALKTRDFHNKEIVHEFIASAQKLAEWRMDIPKLIETACQLMDGHIKPTGAYYSMDQKRWVGGSGSRLAW